MGPSHRLASLPKAELAQGQGRPQGPLLPYQAEHFPSGSSQLRECSCCRSLGRPRIYPERGGRTEPHRIRWARSSRRKSALRGGPEQLQEFCGQEGKTKMLNNLTFSRHAHSSERRGFAGGAVPGQDHQLPLPVGGGAVEITGLAGDVDIVI